MKNFIPRVTVSVKPELMADGPMSIIELKVELPYQNPYYLNHRISDKELLTSSYLEVLFEHATKEVIQHIKQQIEKEEKS